MTPFYLDLEAAAAAVALSPATVERKVREGTFPRPRKVSERRVAWYVPDLAKWAEQQPVSELPPPANTSRRQPKPSAPA